MLPDFGQVARRARWRRRRSKLTTFGTMVLVLGILGPAGVAADLRQAAVEGWVSPPDQHPNVAEPSVSASTPPVQTTVTAAGGTDLNNLYALVDVCVGDSCSLELSHLGGGASGKPVETNLLRSTPSSSLDMVGLAALTPTSLLVRGLADGDTWRYERVDINSNDAPRVQGQTMAVSTADRPVQLSHFGKVQAVQARTGRLLALPSQPPLTQPTLFDNLAPSNGIWVLGSLNGQLAMSVSRDAGNNWLTQPLGLPAAQASAFDPAVFATNPGASGGRVAYLLMRLASEDFALFSTVDGGATWRREPGQLPWPQPVPVGVQYGLVVRPDGTLLAWLSGSPTITYLESTDSGNNFRVTSAGPGAPVFAVPGGYVELGTGSHLRISADAANWVQAQVSYAVPGG